MAKAAAIVNAQAMAMTVDEVAESACVDPGDVLALAAMYPDDEYGIWEEEGFERAAEAVSHVCRNQIGGLRFHDLRHSYATWLVDDGVPPNMVQRVMGHERSSTTLDLYTRRTDNPERLLEALSDPDDDF
jgi:hypothetical protein